MEEKQILCIDLKSFYASVECSLRNLNPYTTPLVVADPTRNGGIVLAVSPYLRTKGVPSRCRLYEVPKVPGLIIAKPQMQKYLDFAIKVLDIYLNFVSDEDLFVYSIDETFLDVTSYLKYYKMNSYELAVKILKEIYSTLGIYATCGIGKNMLLAKLALDLESKTKADYIAKWNDDDIENKLWKVEPLSKMWGIGSRMEKNLNRLGITTVYDLAHYDPVKLKKLFGVIGVELYNHANGRDQSKIQDQDNLRPVNARYSIGQVLFRDYNKNDAKLIIKEMVEDLSRRLRLNNKMASVVTISIGYTKKVGGGFSRQMRIQDKTNLASNIYKNINKLFDEHIEEYPIRRITVGVTNLSNSKNKQLSLFEDFQTEELEYQLDRTIDELKTDYGKNIINKASSLLEHSTQIRRNETIGGHNV